MNATLKKFTKPIAGAVLVAGIFAGVVGCDALNPDSVVLPPPAENRTYDLRDICQLIVPKGYEIGESERRYNPEYVSAKGKRILATVSDGEVCENLEATNRRQEDEDN